MNIKHILIVAVALLSLSPAMAQRGRERADAPRDITTIVSDLSSAQKKKLDAISADSRKRIDALQARHKAVRDSINTYMNLDGDQSRRLFPLFDREAQLRALISREMYATKLKIDEVLTPKQREQVRNASHRAER